MVQKSNKGGEVCLAPRFHSLVRRGLWNSARE